MKHFIAAVGFLLASVAAPVWADAQDDAQRIVELTVNETVFEAAFQAQGPFIVAGFQHQLGEMGITVSDPEAFLDVVIEEMLTAFTADMRQATKAFYLREFSAEELSGIRVFYDSPAGVALLRKTPDLIAFGSSYGAQAGERAAVAARPRIADRIEQDGIEVTKPGLRQRLLDALRQ